MKRRDAADIAIVAYSTVATAPTVYGIETTIDMLPNKVNPFHVATAPTVYGIETVNFVACFIDDRELQQHLPFTVLKLSR